MSFHRRRPSLTLDAGYVSVLPLDRQSTIGLHGKKLTCVIVASSILFLISSINLTCLLWVMCRLDWNFFLAKNSSKLIRIDPLNNQVEFCQQGVFKESIFTTNITDKTRMDFLTDKQFEIDGDQNEIFMDENRIRLTTNQMYIKNQNLKKLTDLYSLKFDCEIKTRVHLNELSSQHIHDKRLNITAHDQLKISDVDQAFFYSHYIVFEANRYNRRSIIRFKNPLKEKPFWQTDQEMFSEKIHFKSDSIYLDLPRFPLINNHHRKENGISRLCICNRTHLFLRNFAHLPCPIC